MCLRDDWPSACTRLDAPCGCLLPASSLVPPITRPEPGRTQRCDAFRPSASCLENSLPAYWAITCPPAMSSRAKRPRPVWDRPTFTHFVGRVLIEVNAEFCFAR
jgi:hypothetical protein